MLNVLKAIAVDQEAIHSGSTRPCLMTLEDESGHPAGDYVVKVFKPLNLEQGFNTHKEVFGSVLAEAFDLNTPEAVLVRVNREIIDSLNESEQYKGFNLEPGIYFGCRYIENVLDYSKVKPKALEDWELENIFAFDVLIRNQDRRVKKPNLFFKEDEIFVIDHELSFATALMKEPFLEMLGDKQKYWNFIEIDEPGFQRKHLFLEALRERKMAGGVNFDTFGEYLRTFNPGVLDEYNQQLSELGYEMEEYVYIRDYLEDVKKNSGLFIQLLNELLL